ncbi:MAG: LysM peptidoglycan-binding domain-containing protein [Acidiferrobacterales bacterium]
MKSLHDGFLKALIIGVVLAVVSACATAPTEEAAPAAPEAAPEAAPAPKEEAQPAPAPEPKKEMMMKETVVVEEAASEYTVARGDNLWDISSFRIIYGNPYMWPLIYKANSDQIADADLIFPGQVLTIPRDSSAAQIESAIQHARNRGAWTLGVVEQSDLAYLKGSM